MEVPPPSLSPESVFLEDFGQTVDLTRRIREVLLNYPEGTTVLKELIQNADDAGASKLCFCLDRRVHGRESLLSESLAQWQGPALLAFNDAVFTEEDFVSISKIGGSSKHGQAWKTGRFGVGFNSVYHLTDLPSFVSGKYVVMFDPQGIYLPKVSSANPGKRIDFTSSSAISSYEDQFFPYCAFGCNMRDSFKGTLFRFPLRNADQSARSKLSKQAYVADDISSMFSQLYEEGVFTLLFLKSLLTVEMYEWNDGQTEARKLYSCSLSSRNKDTIWHRQTLFRMSKSVTINDDVMGAFSLEFLSETTHAMKTDKRVDAFYVVQKMASASSRIGSFATTAAKQYDIHLLPWASVAACTSDVSLNNDCLRTGRAFCFLPLPVRTGLTIQVNGFFEVSSNRRGIWYGDDMDRSGKIRSTWNRLLLEDVVAPVFLQLLLALRTVLGPTNSYYSLWPCGSFEEPWKSLVDYVYRNISSAPLLHTDLGGGSWVSPVEAFLHDEEFSRSNELGVALVQLGMPLVHLPRPLFDMLLHYDSCKAVTPATVRHYLRGNKALNILDKQHKLVLLEYCLEDLIDEDVGSEASSLPLLPLANGDFGLLSEDSKEITYFICDELEYKLMEPAGDRIIDHNIPPKILRRLSGIAKSSTANLHLFSINYFIELFSRFVPDEWKFKSQVLWDQESFQNPSSSWFMLFWQYLKNQEKILPLFRDWPILPSTSGHLYRPSGELKMIRAGNLSDKLQHILASIGCIILSPSFVLEHPDLANYICDCNLNGVLDSISSVLSRGGLMQPSFQNLVDDDRDELRQFLLDPKWYIGLCMNELSFQVCKRLPIFRVYARQSSPYALYSDLENPLKYLPPLDIPDFVLGGGFIIRASNVEEDILSRYYGVQRMGKARFYREQVFNKIQELQSDIRDGIMISVLQNLPQLSLEDVSIRECLRNLEFVPTRGNILKSPSILYDPGNEELYALLEDSDSFPCGPFQEFDILDILRGLGLRTSVSPETVLESARQIEQLMQDDQQKAYSRGKVLLSYLEVNALKWLPDSITDDKLTVHRMFTRAATTFKPRHSKSDLERFWINLRLISWCPVLMSPPFKTLPWPVVTSMVAPPKLVRLQADLWIVSASMRILDGECSSTALSSRLGWLSPPGGSVIAAQLLELGKNNEVVSDQVLRQELAVAMPRIYSILASLIGSDEMDIVKAILEGCRWIWVGDGFATSEEVVLNGPLHLAPYIRVIPTDLAVFRDLFLELGIRDSLQSSDYADILHRMAVRKSSSPLNSQEIRAAMLIVHYLAEVQFHDQHTDIYLPDTSGRLFRAADLVYNDAPWLLGSEHTDGSLFSASNMALSAKATVLKFVHGNISNDVAERLGVCSLRRILLAESADSMNLGLSGAAEAFGQHEALTTRLRHILEMYADGPGILFELVQNAEDAGASEVTFLLDKTQYGTSSVLSPEMADWQGPALYCFNNSVFSSQDLYAISRIGQESKLQRPFAIGRFGLGFNCVYHFTDIPIFVSGENIVMFDPHASHLPGISPSHPGLRIKFVGRHILEQFPDQFSPLLHFGCDLQQPFPGTLFRFPLRNGTVASRSQIKKEEYTIEDVASLFGSFKEVVAEALLFLRNVKTISIFVKEGTGQEMQLVHRVQKTCISPPELSANALQDMFDFVNVNRRGGMDRDQFLKKISLSTNSDLPYRFQKVAIMEESISGNISHCWVTSECLGGENWQKINSAVSTTNSYNFIPWACVAAYLHSFKFDGESNGFVTLDGNLASSDILQVPNSLHQREQFEGRAFCFLPLPISTGLPVHINAYFELSSNRRDIWFGSDMAGGGKKRSDWNIYLLENVVAPAYGHLLEKLASEAGPSDQFFSFWPIALGFEPWASVVRKLYTFMAECGTRVLYTKARGGQWISTKQSIFPDFTFPQSNELVEALSGAGLPVVSVPQLILERFKEVCPQMHFLTPKFLRTLLIRRKREFKDRNAVILILEYCLLDFKVPFQFDTLFGLRLIPLANCSFTSIEKNSSGERVYITGRAEYGLLKDSIPQQVVDSDIPHGVHQKLCNIAQSECTNISFLSCQLLEKLFVKLLPVEWEHAKLVNWTPGVQGHPSLQWLQLLWEYLKSCCCDLSLFSKWPILPVGHDSLMQLTKNSNVIKNEGWSEKMYSLLSKVGCIFLRDDIRVEHPQIGSFVQSPSLCGLLNVFLAVAGEAEKIGEIFYEAPEGELHELRSFVLQSKWFSEDQVDDIHSDMIRDLPVFESYRSRKLVSLSNPVKWLNPTGVLDGLLDDNFIRTESPTERTIMIRYLGIKEPNKVEFYRDYVFSHMSDYLLHQESISAILQDVKLLIREDTSTACTFSTARFVLAADGSWQQPSRLYDPRVPELQKMLHRNVFFPSDTFSDPETLDILVSLGLRQSLGLSGLLDCARSVSLLNDSGDSEALEYGRKLLAYLDALACKLSTKKVECNDELYFKLSSAEGDSRDDPNVKMALEINSFTGGLSCSVSPDGNEDCSEDHPEVDLGNSIDEVLDEEFWSNMRVISWCPVLAEPPIHGLPWLNSSQKLAPPTIVRPESQMWLASSSMHILDGKCHSTFLPLKLGWMGCPKIDVLLVQLIELSRSYDNVKLHASLKSDFDAAAKYGIPLLYSKLQDYASADDWMALKVALDGIPWVWICDDFVLPSALAFDSPVNFTPYIYAVPTELSEFKDLLIKLGVRLSFGIGDYLCVLQQLQNDSKVSPLSTDQLNFVCRVLEAISECLSGKPLFELSDSPLWIPDTYGVLRIASDLVYNDAPWLDDGSIVTKHFVHPCISNDLANRLGVQSVRCLSLVNEDMTKDLPCMNYQRVNELLAMYGNNDFLLFDLLELADCCKATKLHIIFDKREHHRQSLLQHNLGDFQGPALLAIIEGASLSMEEIGNLQLLPPWRLRGNTLQYGLGLLSCYFICDVLSIISEGYFYVFDPRGLALSSPSAKTFSLIGTDLTHRFQDQFSPMLIDEVQSWSSSDSTIIRMPLSSVCLKDGLAVGLERIQQITDRFLEQASSVLLFLKSVLQVSMSTWEEGTSYPCQKFSVCIDPTSAILRNPFSEKKWRKFQLSRLFSSSNAAIKMHIVDVTICREGTTVTDKWVIALSLGSGQTRNMALDRRYLAYNLTPVAGIAANISQNGQFSDAYARSSIMSPLPLSTSLNMPVSILGCFLVCHNRGRYLFKFQDVKALAEAQPDAGNLLIESWNRELMACVRDAYVEMILEIQKLRRDPSSSIIDPRYHHSISLSLKTHEDQIYSFWPRTVRQIPSDKLSGDNDIVLFSREQSKADWECVREQVICPFYSRVVDLPLWQLYSGNLVKAEEGMFLSQPGDGVTGNLLPATVCSFVKEHYPVFSIPWELVTEIQALGFPVRKVKPKMVRDLLKVSSISIVLRSVEMYIDVLEYCLTDFHQAEGPSRDASPADSASSSNTHHKTSAIVSSCTTSNFHSSVGLRSQNGGSSGDALEMMTSLGRALFDFGRGVVEDISRTGGPLADRIAIAGSSTRSGQNVDGAYMLLAAELKGLPCPTTSGQPKKLGSAELWLGNTEQQALMAPLGAKFIHPNVLDRPILASILYTFANQGMLELKNFSLNLLASHMKVIFHDDWVRHVRSSNMAPWVSWDNKNVSDGQGGPSPEWIRLFWKNFSNSHEHLSLFQDWPLIPAFLGRPVLCRVRERHLVFIPPPTDPMSESSHLGSISAGTDSADVPLLGSSEVQIHILAFEKMKDRYPWLLSILNQCNVPIFDTAFMECAGPCSCFPISGQSLGQVIVNKLLAATQAGYFPELNNLSSSDCDGLFALLANDFLSNSSIYGREELEVLRSLPIYKTVTGSYTKLHGQDQCIVSSDSFLKPCDQHCLSYSTESNESSFLRALGVPKLHDHQVLVRFGLPGFVGKSHTVQEDMLIYIYMNWQDLESDQSVVDALKETRFVRNSDEFSTELSKPNELFDPGDALLVSVFSRERKRFPGERFGTDGWLRILRKLGLRTTVEVDVILDCARRVEFLGNEYIDSGDGDDFNTDINDAKNEISLEIWTLAGTVVEAIFSNFAVYYSNNFCNLLGKIACIPAELGFPNVGCKRVLISYSEAILSKDWPLAWSCSPILPKQGVIPPEYSWGALRLKSPPDFFTVLKHLQVIGKNGGDDTLSYWPLIPGMLTIDEATCEILKYLNKIWDSISSSDIMELRRVAFLPAANGTRLVTANSLFARLTINLSPFAFELPTLYLPFVKILKELGLQETLAFSSAKDLLLNLQKACGYQHLNPNELRAVFGILNFVCEQMKSTDGSNWKSDAIVPDDGGRLVHSASCVYVDSYGAQYVKFIDTSRIRFAHPDLPERICLELGIQKLSDIVVEELDEEEHLQTLECIGSIPLAAIRQKLSSRCFQFAVWTIVNNVTSFLPAVNNLSLDAVQISLNSLAERLVFVKCLRTRFLLLPNSVDITRSSSESIVPEWKDGSRHRTLFFVNRSKSCVIVAEPPTYISLCEVIAIVVSQVLSSLTVVPIGPLLVCPEGSETAIIEILKLCCAKRKLDPVIGNSSLVGKDIMAQDARLVQFHPLRPFYAGEIVAWRLQNGEKLKYGRVQEDVRPAAGQTLYKLKVETAPETIQIVLSSQVFSFKSAMAASGSVPETLPEETRTTTGNVSQSKAGQSSESAKSFSEMQSLKDLQYGKVSATEVVKAVNEMLSAAGMNIDMEKQSLLENTLTLQEQLKESQAALLLEQERADVAAREADNAKAAWLCRICLTAEVDVTLVPCGHVLCRRCSSAVSKCPFCRLQVAKTVRIFRP